MEKEKIEKIIRVTKEMCESKEFCKDCPYAIETPNGLLFDCVFKEGVILEYDVRNSPSIAYGRAIRNIIHLYCRKVSCNFCSRKFKCNFRKNPENWETDEEE